MKKTVLLTGCAGFIGSNFVKTICTRKEVKDHYDFVIIDSLTYAGKKENIEGELKAHSHLSFIQMDIRDKSQVHELFRTKSFYGVINFAAESHVDRSIESPHIFVETNVLGTLNLLYCALETFNKTGDFRFHQISTDEVYGTLSSTDPAFTEKTPLNPNSPYSASKTGADCLVRSFFETYGLPTIITRCSNNYGPYQVPEKFIPVVIRKAMNNETVPVYGNGMNVRDWIYVDDHNEGAWLAFTKGKAGEVYNLGGKTEKQNIDLAKIILKKLNKPESLLQFVTDRKGHDFRYAIDFTKAEKELNWSPKMSFEQGIEKTIEWYTKNENR
ncbi:MAG: dTDP-glucose 4,6-dehydratase [Bacteriovoracaceae bacterium]